MIRDSTTQHVIVHDGVESSMHICIYIYIYIDKYIQIDLAWAEAEPSPARGSALAFAL